MSLRSNRAATTKANHEFPASGTDTASHVPNRVDVSTGQLGRRTLSKKDPIQRTYDIYEEELNTIKYFPRTCTHNTHTYATYLANTLTASSSNVYSSQIVCAQCARPWQVSQLTLFAF